MARRQNGYIDVDDNAPFLSEYNKRYPVHSIEPRHNYKPSTQPVRVEEPMEVNTSNKLDYPAWDLPERKPRERPLWNPPADPFGGESTAKGDFKGTYLPKQKSYKPDAKPFQSQDPLDAHTTTGVDYPAYDIKPRPRRQPQPYQKPDGRMEGNTLNRLNYPEHEIQPRQSYKPTPAVTGSGEPLDSTTTASLDYKPYQIEPRQPRERQKWVKPDGKMDGVTTSRSEYPQHELQPRENYKPAANVQKSNDPFKGDTTSKLDFPAHQIEPRRKRQAQEYIKPDGRMEDQTSNRRDYPQHDLSPTRSFKPQPVVQPSEPFDGETTARKEFKEHQIEPRKRREPAKYTRPEGKMDGVSTSRSEFPQHEITPRKSYKPDNTVQKSEDPFSKDTTSALSYPEYKIEPRQRKQAQPYVKPDGKMDGISTNAAEFPRHELQARESFKPPNNVMNSNEKFDDQTTARLNYPEHPIEPRQKRQQVQYTGPEGVFDGTTSNRQDYPVHELTPRETFKPANSVQRSSEPFDHKTSQNLDYPAYDIEPRKRREQQKYVKPDGKIDGVTTNRAEFPQHELHPRKSYKPDNSYQMSTDPSEKFSTTRREYPEHKIEPRQMRQPEPYRKPDGKIDGVSTNRAEFPQHELQPRHSYKPDNKYEKSSVPFDDTTLARLNYPEHPIEPRQKRQQVQYTGPEGDFDGTTSNRQDYPVHELTPRETFKPANSVQRSTEPFDHKTSQNLDYPAYDIEPRKRREQQKYVKPDGKIDGVTTNRAEFPQHELTPRQPFKPSDSYLKSDDRFNGDTISRLDYQEYPIEPRQTKPAQQYVPPEGKMEVDTSNRLDYPTHQLQPRMNYKPANEVQKAEGKFEGTTTTEQDYPAHVIEPRQKRQQVQYTGPEGAFDGTTSNRQDYPVHELTPRETFKPANSVQRSTEPFDHKTSQNLDYPAYDIEPRKRREQQKYVKPDGKIDDVTTNRAEFPQHELTPRHLFKPNDSYLKSDDPFNGDTTFRSNYPEHPIEARTVKTHEPYIKPEGVIEGDTTNRLDYREYEIKPRQSFKPVSSVENSKEPFNGDTTTRSEYPAHDIEPRKVIDRHQYVKPEGHMEKMTSNQLDYPQHDLTPRETFKPKDSVQQSDVPFDGDTTSRRDFKEHDITPRQKRDQAKYVKPEGKFEGDTTNNAEYPTHELKPTQSCRPSNEPMLSQDPFDGSTTSRRDYGEHKIEPRQAVQQDIYKKPEGDIDFNTINKLNFVETVPQREMLKRPESSHIMERGAHFQGNTRYAEDFKGHEITPRKVLKTENYRPPTVPMETMSSARLDYQQHELPKQEAVRPKEAYSSPKVKFDGTTTNADSYKGEFVPKTQSFKPNGEPLQSGVPFDDTTTSKRDFQQHQVEPRKIITGKPYEKPEGLMYLNTTSKEAFTPKSSPRDKVMRPESSHLMNRNSKFEGSSNYGSDFVQHDVQPRELINKSQDYNPPNISMETSTINKLTFTQHPIEKTQNFKPAAVVEKPPPFEGKTGYSDTFVGHQIPQKEVRPKQAYETPKTKFEGTTTTGDSFKGVSAPKQQSYRPSNAPFNSGAPLDDRTTAKQDFKEHKVERRQVVEKAQYAKPDGGFDFNTTNKLTFTPKKTSRSTPTKPGSSGVMGRGGQFEGSTNYGSDFQSHEVTPRTLVKKSNDYTPPAIPMVTETTNKKDFTKPVLGPRQPYKPIPMPQMSKEPFAGSTGYRESFKEFEVPRKMVKTKNEYNPPKVPFNGTTTNRQDFTGTTASKRDAFKPMENTFKSKAPLESSTTSKRDFGSHPVERREVAKRAQWVKPEGRMELQTTNNDNFKQPTPIGRNSAPRPKSSGILKFGGKIEGITNYSSDFIQREGGGRPGLLGKTAYVPNPHPFQGTTTNRSDFTQRDGVKATSFKPLAVPFSSNARFDNSTTYSADFTKSAPPWMAHIPDPIAVGGPTL